MKLNEAINQLGFMNSKTLQKTKFLQESSVKRLIENIYNYIDVSLIGTIEAQKQWNIQLEDEIKRLEPFEVNYQGLKRRFDNLTNVNIDKSINNIPYIEFEYIYSSFEYEDMLEDSKVQEIAFEECIKENKWIDEKVYPYVDYVDLDRNSQKCIFRIRKY